MSDLKGKRDIPDHEAFTLLIIGTIEVKIHAGITLSTTQIKLLRSYLQSIESSILSLLERKLLALNLLPDELINDSADNIFFDVDELLMEDDDFDIDDDEEDSSMKTFQATNETIRKAVNLWCKNKELAITRYGNISTWDTSNVTDMKELFNAKNTFNDDISMWNVSNVMNMNAMFSGASMFNQSLYDWNVCNVRDMSDMFIVAFNFNQPLNQWNVSNVVTMNSMFSGTSKFNQPLNNWNVCNVIDMSYMFWNATSFNQPLNDWKVNHKTNMNDMFYNALNFNHWYSPEKQFDDNSEDC